MCGRSYLYLLQIVIYSIITNYIVYDCNYCELLGTFWCSCWHKTPNKNIVLSCLVSTPTPHQRGGRHAWYMITWYISCGKNYIGATYRALRNRLGKHQKQTTSAIYEHQSKAHQGLNHLVLCDEIKYCPSYDHFKYSQLAADGVKNSKFCSKRPCWRIFSFNSNFTTRSCSTYLWNDSWVPTFHNSILRSLCM